jgi:hypothetical protein
MATTAAALPPPPMVALASDRVETRESIECYGFTATRGLVRVAYLGKVGAFPWRSI